MNRTKFYNKVTVNDVQELDFLDNNLAKFAIKNTPRYIRVNASDVQRPDLISWRNYDTVRYWWLVLLTNSIENPLEDMEEGVRYVLPSILDIYKFYRTNSLR